MTPAVWLLGFAAGMLLVGVAGIGAAIVGHVPDWTDLYWLLPTFVTGAASGWLLGAGLEISRLHTNDGLSHRERDMTLKERAAKLTPPVSLVDDEPESIGDELTRLQRTRQFQIAHWRVYYRRIVAAGCAYGWDIRTLTDKKRDTRVTTQPGWNLSTDKLVEAGVLSKDGTTRMLISEDDWNSERMWERVPCPEGEPPEILPPPYTRQQTLQQTMAKQATVDG